MVIAFLLIRKPLLKIGVYFKESKTIFFFIFSFDIKVLPFLFLLLSGSLV